MKQKIDALWSELRVINKETWPNQDFELDPAEFRFDDYGAIVKWSEYGMESEFGWNVDHLFPLSKGGDDNIDNLQLTHWGNNKSKGDDFPLYKMAVTRSNEKNVFKNAELILGIAFSNSVYSTLENLYPNVKLYPIPEGEWYSLPDLFPVSLSAK